MEWLADNWLSLFGWCGSALLIYSLLQTRVLRLRALNLLACISLATFNALIQVWPMVGMNVATSLINLFFLVRLLRERHDEDAFQVLEVAPRDAYFQHFLNVHLDELRKFYPGFAGTQPDDLAFQVRRGDETVGIVLIRPDGEVARVQLDYVTPRFRDFSPGEFVWSRVDRLRARGFTRVVTPPGMVNPYYSRLPQAFRRDGEAYALDL